MNAADHTGQTALHWSAVRGAVQVAELLLQEGANVGAADMYGYQVDISLLYSHFEMFICRRYPPLLSQALPKNYMRRLTITSFFFSFSNKIY